VTETAAIIERPTELRLARLHLRTGALGLARAELETLAGAGSLDDEALLDLAEVRWRTDDLTGAGEAAAAYIATGHEALIALVIAAEATSALGRPGEARRLAGRALELADGPLDGIFAGMPRSDAWPPQPAEHVAPTAASSEVQPVPPEGTVESSGAERDRLTEPVADPGAELDAPRQLDAARAALAAGDPAGAAIRLAIVLRLAPALAPAVLEVAATEPGPAFDLVRGDALRLVGRETQARQSFAAAAREGLPPADRDDAAAAGTEG
jgi:hypothetical protein